MAGKDNKNNSKPRIIRQGKSTAESELALKQMRRQQIANMKKETASAASPGADLGAMTGGIKRAMEKKRTQNNAQAMKSVSAAYERAFGKRKK